MGHPDGSDQDWRERPGASVTIGEYIRVAATRLPLPPLLLKPECRFPHPAPKTCWFTTSFCAVLQFLNTSQAPPSGYIPAFRSLFGETSCAKNLPLFCRSVFCQVSVRLDELKRCNVLLPLAGGRKRQVVCARTGPPTGGTPQDAGRVALLWYTLYQCRLSRPMVTCVRLPFPADLIIE